VDSAIANLGHLLMVSSIWSAEDVQGFTLAA